MIKKLIFVISIFFVLNVMAQDCPCPTTILNEIPTTICTGFDVDGFPCIELDFNNACIDTFYIELDSPDFVWFPLLGEDTNDVCVLIRPLDFFGFCEPLTTGFDLTIECIDGSSFTQSIPPFTMYPPKESFGLNVQYNSAPCSGGAQFSPGRCAGVREVLTIPSNDIVCDLQDGMFIWTTYPSFDYTGAESCYEPFLSDTTILTPCPRDVTHGPLEGKGVGGNE